MMAEAGDDPELDIASRVLIVDDSAAVRAGLRALVATDPSLRTVGEAANAVEGLEVARTTSPDVVLLDNEMPGMRGIELLPVLRRELPGSHIVMFTLSPAISDEARALGASAVVSKDGGDATLLDTLREVRRGDRSTTVRLATVARLRRERPRASRTSTPSGRSSGCLRSRERCARPGSSRPKRPMTWSPMRGRPHSLR